MCPQDYDANASAIDEAYNAGLPVICLDSLTASENYITSICTDNKAAGAEAADKMAELLGETSDLSVYEENANILYDALTKMGFSCVRPGGTFYMFPRSPEEDAKAFCQKALAYNLVLVPGDSFGCPGFFRISYCVPTEKVKRSLAAFEKLAQAYGLC